MSVAPGLRLVDCAFLPLEHLGKVGEVDGLSGRRFTKELPSG